MKKKLIRLFSVLAIFSFLSFPIGASAKSDDGPIVIVELR